MTLWILIAFAALTVVHGIPAATVIPSSASQTVGSTQVFDETDEVGEPLLEDGVEEDMMATGPQNPNHFPAQRAASVVSYYINTRHGSPYRWFSIHTIHSCDIAEVAGSGRRYQLKLALKEFISNTTEDCSAEVMFPMGNNQSLPTVQVSCEEQLKFKHTAEEETFYQQHKSSNNPVSGDYIPDSHGHIDPSMEPLWHLGGVASNFIMLKESNESTKYNMAQIVNVTQLETENEQLRFNYHVLLHDMVSQEIIPWKMLVTWSPVEGVKVSQMQKLPKCHECEAPPNTTN